MTLLLLAACGLSSSTPPTDSGADTAVDTATDTGDTGTGPIAWTRYKIDSAASVRGVYSSGQGVYVVTTRGEAWVGSATQAWTAVELPAELDGIDLNGLWGNGAGDTLELAVAADNGVVAIYSLGAWTVSSTGVGDNLGIDGTSLSDLYVVGEGGIFHYDGSGWLLDAATDVQMNAVYAYAGGALAAGNEGVAMLRGASSWSTTDTGRLGNFHGLAGSGASDVWMVGDQGLILHWTGSAWTTVAGPITDTLNAVFVADANAAIAVGNSGKTIAWNGTAWTETVNDTNQNLYGIHGVSGVNAWAVGDGGLTMQYKP